MLTDFTRFPPEFAARYRQRGYWIDQPLTRALDQAQARCPDAIAVIDDAGQFTYAKIARAVTSLANRLRQCGLGQGDRAVVQLPNCAEFVIVFHALLRAGIVPVNAIFSHRALEMTSYIEQLRPALLIGDLRHELFASAAFLAGLERRGLRPDHVIVNGAPGGLSAWLTDAGTQFPANPTPPDEVAFFQLSGGSTGTPKLIPRSHNDYDYSIRASADICGLNA